MNEKTNDATRNRPGGERIIDAAFLRIDLPTYVHQIKQEEAWQKNDHNAITVFKTNSMRMVLMALHKNTEIKPHTAEGVMSVQVLEGVIRFNTEEENADVKAGQVVTLHKGIIYSVYAIEESTFLLTISNV